MPNENRKNDLSRAEKLFSAFGEVDEQLLAKSETPPERTSRLPSVLTAAACLCIVAATVLIVPRLIPINELPDDTPAGDTSINEDLACWADIVRTGGYEYMNVEILGAPSVFNWRSALDSGMPDGISLPLGRKIGEVGVDLKTDGRSYTADQTGATFLPVGSGLYEWEGYHPSFRLIGVKDGMAFGYELAPSETSVPAPLDEMFPVRRVTAVEIVGGSAGEDLENAEAMGELNGADAKAFAELFASEASFTGKERPISLYGESYQVVFLLDDGTSTSAHILISNNEVSAGSWCGLEIAATGRLQKAVTDSLLYHGGAWENRGGVYAAPGFAAAPGVYRGSDYAFFPLRVIDGKLVMERQPGSALTLTLAEDCAGDIRIDGKDIWYRTTEGGAAHLTFWYPFDDGSLKNALEKGKDLSDHLTAPEPVNFGTDGEIVRMLTQTGFVWVDFSKNGGFVRMQVQNGVVWALDGNGILMNSANNTLLTDVTCFALDDEAVLFGTDKELIRMSFDGTILMRKSGGVKAVSSGGLYLCYITSDGSLRRCRVDGKNDVLLSDRKAKAVFCGESDSISFIEPDGTVWISIYGYDFVKVDELAGAKEVTVVTDNLIAARYEEDDCTLYVFERSADGSPIRIYEQY